MRLKELLFGRPLRTDEERVEQVGIATAIPVLGLDALGSASYGPEAAMTALLALGMLASHYIGWITGAILLVLFPVFLSYLQTIPAYPQGGGSFTVARENLGPFAGLLAASALSVDYILNAAVAISAGVGALVSAVPFLLPYTLPLCLAILILLTVINLRGVRSAGVLLLVPAYAFVGSLLITVVLGIIRVVEAHGHPVPIVAPPRISPSVQTASAWLLMRAFASGCAALTGVEAVSNAVPVFRKPKVTLARRTLTILIIILSILLAGIAFLARAYHVSATAPGQPGYESLLSQLVGAVAGRGIFYYIALGSVLFVLALSANTSFAGFPRVCRLLALDEYLPAEFAHRGSRLVYSCGILVLALFAGLLLLAFRGITDRLIPLFAIGAFGAFTLSQLGMVFHWRRSREPGARRSMILNGLGAFITGATLLVLTIAKFSEGAWLVLALLPPLLFLFSRIRRYHTNVEREIEEQGPLDTSNLSDPIVVVPLKRLDRVGRKALRLALSMASDIHVVQIMAEDMNIDDLKSRWHELVENPVQNLHRRPPVLTVLPSAYRNFFGPLIGYLKELCRKNPDRHIAVIIPELVERRWYHFLFRHRATLLKTLLILRGGPPIVIISAPWYVAKAAKREAFAG
ncbi:MAG TPA: APC family permease [Candidatus Dormibacteraeota bacterium]|nr:APC family permease [Candidatus Dormibacteraeota bacterium]